MTAALIHQRPRHEGLQPISLSRDLVQVAELIEASFADRMDANGRAAVREMKAIGQMGPLLWLFVLLGLEQHIGTGFVWRDNGQVIGNVSLYRAGIHPILGQGWMAANVAVQPDYRRRGIARDMMLAAVNRVRREHGQWIALQVEADNQAALQLYESLDFQSFETLVHWRARRLSKPLQPVSTIWKVRRRRGADAASEIDLIFNRARIGAMMWTRPINRGSVQGGFLGDLDILLEGPNLERWVIQDPLSQDRLIASAWISAAGWQKARVSLFIDPALDDPIAYKTLLAHLLTRPILERRMLRIETAQGQPIIDEMLEQAGFTQIRYLTQMRRMISQQN